MSGDLKWNKIFGAALGTAFVILVVQQASGLIYHSEPPEKMGYFVDAPDEVAGAEQAELPPDWGTVLPTADLAAGEAAFARCQACHNATQGGADGIGPNLYGVVGGPVMHRAGFAYSDAMAKHKAEAPTWGYDQLNSFITAPARYVPGTKMSFAGIRDTQTRINLIAWLRSQGSSGFAIPAPDPARQPGAAEQLIARPTGRPHRSSPGVLGSRAFFVSNEAVDLKGAGRAVAPNAQSKRHEVAFGEQV
ncbi:c-type cytochrome [Brevundimonas aurantiaca]|uniref:c-type cytochrome n=1 Tax=Brevundimonas aurantiaca TaxID=74316 RepID=UPI001CD2E963|nr:cytochrome c family protein [Brevundimonas aurantiaca]